LLPYDRNIFRSFLEVLAIFNYCILGNLLKMLGNIRLAFRQLLENLWKSLESVQKSSEIAKNVVIYYENFMLCDKKKITCCLEIQNFYSHVEKYFTHSLCWLVKYFSTFKEKFCISARPCNILYNTHCNTTMLYSEQGEVIFYTLWATFLCFVFQRWWVYSFHRRGLIRITVFLLFKMFTVYMYM